jgi:hypothetical protein
MPDPGSGPGQALIRHPATDWIPAFAGMTIIKMFDCLFLNWIKTFSANKLLLPTTVPRAGEQGVILPIPKGKILE